MLLLQSKQVPPSTTSSSSLDTRVGRILAACRGLEARIESLRHGQSPEHAALQHHAQCTRMDMLITTLKRVRAAGKVLAEEAQGGGGGTEEERGLAELARNPGLGLEWSRGWLEQVSSGKTTIIQKERVVVLRVSKKKLSASYNQIVVSRYFSLSLLPANLLSFSSTHLLTFTIISPVLLFVFGIFLLPF